MVLGVRKYVIIIFLSLELVFTRSCPKVSYFSIISLKLIVCCFEREKDGGKI